MPRQSFKEPTSAADAQARRDVLIDDILAIQAQLTQKRVVGHIDDAEYRTTMEWRRKTVFALNVKQREMSFIKAWMRANAARGEVPPGGELSFVRSDVPSLLRAVNALLGRLYGEIGWNEIKPDEQLVVDEVRRLLG